MHPKVELAMKVLTLLADHDTCEDVWWRTDGEYAPITFIVNCDDLFYWACADAVEITEDNFPLMVQAYGDADAINCPVWAATLFCTRTRAMRPQPPCYKGFPQVLWPLLDECGPKRTAEF